jgi:hypothetical protein
MIYVKTVFMILFMILMCCSNSIGQSSSGIGIEGNVKAVPIELINSGAQVYPIGEQGARVYPIGEHGAGISQPLWEFVCNSMSACGMYDMAWASNGATVNIGGASRVTSGANVYRMAQSKGNLKANT